MGDRGPEFELGTRGSLEVDLQGDHGLSARGSHHHHHH